MNEIDLDLSVEILDGLDWHPCESPYHYDDPRDEHEGDGEYVVIFHACPGIAPGPTVRCARWVLNIHSFSEIRCLHCKTVYSREYYALVLGRVE